MRLIAAMLLLTGCAASSATQDGPNVAGKGPANPACLISCKSSITITNVRDNAKEVDVDKAVSSTKTTEGTPK
jgi:uncharacterized lipoprotein YajG